jgi:hypothetical protein
MTETRGEADKQVGGVTYGLDPKTGKWGKQGYGTEGCDVHNNYKNGKFVNSTRKACRQDPKCNYETKAGKNNKKTNKKRKCVPRIPVVPEPINRLNSGLPKEIVNTIAANMTDNDAKKFSQINKMAKEDVRFRLPKGAQRTIAARERLKELEKQLNWTAFRSGLPGKWDPRRYKELEKQIKKIKVREWGAQKEDWEEEVRRGWRRGEFTPPGERFNLETHQNFSWVPTKYLDEQYRGGKRSTINRKR